MCRAVDFPQELSSRAVHPDVPQSLAGKRRKARACGCVTVHGSHLVRASSCHPYLHNEAGDSAILDVALVVRILRSGADVPQEEAIAYHRERVSRLRLGRDRTPLQGNILISNCYTIAFLWIIHGSQKDKSVGVRILPLLHI